MSDFFDFKSSRIQLGLTIEQVAAGICSPSYLSLIERGLRVPKARLRNQLEKRLSSKSPDPSQLFSPSDEFLVGLASFKAGALEHVFALSDSVAHPQEAALLRAIGYEAMGDFEIAKTLLTGILSNPAISEFQVVLATQAIVRLCRDDGDFYNAVYWAEKSLSALQTANQRELKIYELQATLSSVYLEVGDYRMAQRLINEIDYAEANDWERIVQLWAGGLLKFNEGKLGESAAMLREAVYLSSAHDRALSKARILQTCIWLEAKNGSAFKFESLTELGRLASYFEENKMNEDTAQTFNTMSLIYARNGDREMALEFLDKSLALVPELAKLSGAKIRLWNSEVLLALGDVLRAKEVLHPALLALSELKPNRATAVVWAELGNMYKSFGDDHSALNCLQASVEAAGFVPSSNVQALG